jgi:hypothetical protein
VIDLRFPWIQGIYTNRPLWRGQVVDTRTGEQVIISTEGEFAHFVATHSAAQGHGGLGDLVRGVTRKLGFGECTPCAKRQAAFNRMAPRLYRR